MPPYLWLLIGIFVGMLARFVMNGQAFGSFVDIILGVVGAFMANWVVQLPNIETQLSWAGKSSIMIWAAASLPLLARILAKHRASRRTPVSRPSSAVPSDPGRVLTPGDTRYRMGHNQVLYIRQILSTRKSNREPSHRI